VPMTFAEARNFIMPNGKHAGQTLDKIAETDPGLLYLDWLRGQRRRSGEPLDDALAAYLDDPTIAKDIKPAIKRDSRPLRAQRGEGLEWRTNDRSAFTD